MMREQHSERLPDKGLTGSCPNEPGLNWTPLETFSARSTTALSQNFATGRRLH
jgi:hypothetical protein